MRVLPLLACCALLASPARAADVKTCEEAPNIGIGTLVPPFNKRIRTFSNDRVRVFNTDTDGEPAACSKGIVITFPEADIPSTKCFYVGCFASVADVSEATASYSADKGLLIVIKTGDYGPNGPMRPTKPLKLRVNQKDGSVKIE